MVSPPEIGLVAAVRYARTLEQRRGFVIRAIVGAEGEIGWNETKAEFERRMWRKASNRFMIRVATTIHASIEEHSLKQRRS